MKLTTHVGDEQAETIACDVPACPQTHLAREELEELRQASELGWFVREEVHLCPAHAPRNYADARAELDELHDAIAELADELFEGKTALRKHEARQELGRRLNGANVRLRTIIIDLERKLD